MHLQDIESLSVTELLQAGFNDKNFIWNINDSLNELRLKYLYSKYDQLAAEDKAFVDNFAEFSSLYVKSDEELTDILEKHEWYFIEPTHAFLTAFSGFVITQHKLCIEYLGCIYTPDQFCNIVSRKWDEVLLEIFFSQYAGPMNEEMETVLNEQGYTRDYIEKIRSDYLREQALHASSSESKVVSQSNDANTEGRVNILRHMFKIEGEVAHALIQGDLSTIANNIEQVIRDAKYHEFFVHIIISHYEHKNELILLLVNSIKLALEKGTVSELTARRKTIANITAVLHERSRELGALAGICLNILRN